MKIARRALESAVAHALDSLPSECCGILLAHGRDCPDAVEAVPATNAEVERPAHRYALGHEAHIEAVRREAEGTARIVGYYHSHPGAGTDPSPLDRDLAVAGVNYLIIGVRDRAVQYAAWRLDGDQFVPEPVELSE